MKSLMCFGEIGVGKPAYGLQASDPAFLQLMQVMA